MKRILLDTNIYGFIVEDKERKEIVRQISKSEDLIIYGSDIIRTELREVPKDVKVDGASLRIDLLNIFDSLVKDHVYVTTDKVEELAGKYYNTYREIGGIKPKDNIIKDFLIVACATIHELDIVCSQDNKSMLTETSIKAYRIVNNVISKRMPKFINYEEFKKEIKRWSS